MDLISTRAMDITKLALDGLDMRQKAITANAANVMTPDYQRKEVKFENQLREIIEKDDLKTMMKEQNSIEYHPSSLDLFMGDSSRKQSSLTPQMAKYLQSDVYGKYNPQVIDDVVSGSDSQGNNVNIESEMMDMTATGLRYNVLATLEQKQVSLIRGAIKGQSV